MREKLTQRTFRNVGALTLVSVVILFGFQPSVYAAAGSEAASFLQIPVGGAPAALGSAYSALAGDAYAPVYNPAGLAVLDGTEIAGQHVAYLESIHYEFASIVHPLKIGRGIGFSAQYLGTGSITERDRDGENIGSYDSHYAAYSAAFGQSFGKLSVGITGKVIQGKIADVSATAYAADLGLLYELRSNLFVSAVAANFGTKLKFIDQADPLPRSLTGGMAWQPRRSINLSVDGVLRQNKVHGVHAGLQWTPLQLISLRAGYRTDHTKELSPMAGLTAGVGLHLWDQELDYAWLPYGDLGNTHYVSLIIRFGAAERGKRNLIRYQSLRHPLASGKAADEEMQNQQLMLLLDADQKERHAEVPEQFKDVQ